MDPPRIHLIESTESPDFDLFTSVIVNSSILALDAEWKPVARTLTPDRDADASSFPSVTMLQLACQIGVGPAAETLVFLLDLVAISVASIWEVLKDVFTSARVLKLGFGFKQDLIYLSHTFSSNGCHPGFDKVEPYMDIANLYHFLRPRPSGRKSSKETRSLAFICYELLGISLSKEFQCSDWSHRPLTEDQIKYAALDAYCLLRIFSVFQAKLENEEGSTDLMELSPSNVGCKIILDQNVNKQVMWNFPKAIDIMTATVMVDSSQWPGHTVDFDFGKPSICAIATQDPFYEIVKKYGEKIVLRECDRKPHGSKKKGNRKPAFTVASRDKQHQSEKPSEWHGIPPWDQKYGGDGCPKFLCDSMVEGLARHLRCVGIDAATPFSKKPEARKLIDQAHKERRVLLTKDAKLLKYQYLLNNQIYKLKSCLKNEQLLEVIEAFQLQIREDQLMSRCTKCNGKFIHKPLTTDEAVEAAKGFQKIPSCLFDKKLEFWQCVDCNQLYWEGTQYHNAVQKFIDVCKLIA